MAEAGWLVGIACQPRTQIRSDSENGRVGRSELEAPEPAWQLVRTSYY